MQIKSIKAVINIGKKYFFIIIGFCIILIFFIANFYGKRHQKNAKKNAKYTVAYITTDWHQKNNRGVGSDFIYFVEGEKYDRTCTSTSILKKGEKYLLLYDSLRPKYFIMLYKQKIFDSLKPPYNGWSYKELPLKLDSTDLKFYFKELNIP